MSPDKYKSIGNGFVVSVREDGLRGLAKGWAPTFIGYSMQGLCKFGLYEVFKVFYADLLGEVRTHRSAPTNRIAYRLSVPVKGGDAVAHLTYLHFLCKISSKG